MGGNEMTNIGLGFTVELRSMKPIIKERTIYSFQVVSENDKEALTIMNELEFAIEAILNKNKVMKVEKSVVVSNRFIKVGGESVG
jgi:hypothetical protein